jgi:thioredoxin reductase (NADPH)
MSRQAFRYCFPDKKLRFEYTTSSSSLQEKLGVDEDKAA